MIEVVDVLLHPSRWGADADQLRPLTRVYLAFLTLFVTFGCSIIAGWLGARWAHRRTQDATSERNEVTIVRLRREFVAIVLFIGGYLAVEMAPLPVKIERILAGGTFVLGAFVCAQLVIRLVALLLTSSVTHVNGHERSRLEREYVPLAEKVTWLAVTLIYVAVVAKYFGKDVSSLVAALGVGSLAIGLAAQATLGNMFAGFILLVDRPFRPGDRIKLATGESGEVSEIGVRSTKIVMGDSNLLVVPNSELANTRVVNYALPTSATRGEIKVVVVPESDIDRATAILLALAAAEERIAKAPAPIVRVSALTERGVELALGFNVNSHIDGGMVAESLRRGLLKKFRSEKIEIAYYKSSQGVPSGSPV